MKYQKVTIKIEPFNAGVRDILIAMLADAGYEGFQESGHSLEAYIPAHLYTPLSEEKMPVLGHSDYQFRITNEPLEDKNWNEEWEKNYFKPIVIADKCLIRSPFQPAPGTFEFEILVEPRMAFGTGHHETTSLMLQHLLETNLSSKRVLDMGCGTGILGILASMLGAREVVGIDNDPRAVENARDTVLLNSVRNMTIHQGDASLLPQLAPFDIILANITRNILLRDIKHYSKILNPGGTLFLSGFYQADAPKIDEEASRYFLPLFLTKEHNYWVAVAYSKATE